ncbi:nodulation protein NfeD [Anaerobacillus alkaliphilus]|uniref:Nodulation protein NfeD n=1 Tax=Anaerobacillus alkaliphilus TaxID=1548597 RepID=A0A4Q0VS41_9BACI|nr:nodulation protein NfeD [Anaerobacillus alkaliphilus]RXI99399.1 nodulation protein NfeD [Anaerobacillus alkaliphilus]
MTRYKLVKRLFFLSLILCSMVVWFLQPPAHSQTNRDTVFFIPVEQSVERGLEAFLRRGLSTAVEEGATHIVLEIDTPGGLVDAATEIAFLIRHTEVPITAYVTGKAWSAGAYIALNADQIVMAPGTSMGSAAVIDGAGNAAEDKMQSAWLATMEEAAQLNGRDPIFARAMADKNVNLPEYRAGEGELLTLTTAEAVKVGYAEAVVSDRDELLLFLGVEDAVVRDLEVSFAEKIARFVTNPVIIPILLSIGSLGLVLELYSPGFGIPGIMGLSALFLFFFGHLVAGFAGFETIILFGAGIILIIIEIFFPGFGIFGILGIVSIIGSMVLASYSTVNILLSIVIALVVTVIVSIFFFKYFGYRGPLKKLILNYATTSEQGYVSNTTRAELVGKVGYASTVLRPSGTAIFDDERLDVVSEGGFISQGKKVKIVSTQGSRIVVREFQET